MAEPPPEHHDSRTQPVILGVDLRLPGRPQQRGKIRQLSPEGALLSWQALPRGLPAGGRLQLGLRLPPGPEGQAFRVTARILHRIDQGLEVHFEEPDAKFTAALQRYLRELDHSRAETERRRAPLRARLRETAVKQIRLAEQADRLIKAWIDSLREQARQAANDEICTCREDDAALLEQAWLNDGLAFTLTARWLNALQPAAAPQQGNRAAACLIDEPRTERLLSVQTLSETLEQAYFHPLEQYRSRIALLADADAPLPFTPDSLVQTLDSVLDRLDLDESSRVLLIKAAYQTLSEIQKLLLERILPDLEGRV